MNWKFENTPIKLGNNSNTEEPTVVVKGLTKDSPFNIGKDRIKPDTDPAWRKKVVEKVQELGDNSETSLTPAQIALKEFQEEKMRRKELRLKREQELKERQAREN